MKKNIVIYHRKCPDGFCAAWIAKNYLKEENTKFVPMSYGDTLPKVDGKDVYIFDISFPPEVITEMCSKANFVVLRDHHKTAVEQFVGYQAPENSDILFDIEYSGAKLADRYFVSDELRGGLGHNWLVDYTEDRDLWKWELANSREICAALSTYPFSFKVWDYLATINPEELVEMGTGIMAYQTQCVTRAAANAFEVKVAGYDVLCVNVAEATLISDVAGELAKGRPFGLSFAYLSPGVVQWSLRSRESELDVSAIAKQFGGGGHKKAAGFITRTVEEICVLPSEVGS